MPPKKKDVKKDVPLKEDNSGIPKSEVIFKFQFQIRHNNIENYMIMWEWISQDTTKTERFDSTLIESWVQKDPTNNPNLLIFDQELDPIIVDDDFCKLLSKQLFYIYIVNVETTMVVQEIKLDYSEMLTKLGEQPQFVYENDKMKVLPIESFLMTISADKPLLQPLYKQYLNPLEIEIIGAKNLPVQTGKKYETVFVRYRFFDGQIVQTPGVFHSNKIKWQSKHVFLAGLMNSITLVEQIRSQFIKMELHDRDEVRDNNIRPQLPLLDVQAKILEEEERNKPKEEEDPKTAGKKGAKKDAAKKESKEPPKDQKKDAAKKDTKKDTKKKGGAEVKIEQPILDQGPPIEFARNNFGSACYFLTDLLKPNVREIKLSAPVVPVKKYEDLESTNLELNTTARMNMKALIESSTYFQNDSFMAISIKISAAIGSFKLPEKKPEEIIETQQVQQGKDASKKGGKAAVATTQQQAAQQVAGAQKKDDKAKDSRPPTQQSAVSQDGLQSDKPVFERAVYIMPYKSPDFVKKIQDAFYDINLKAAKIDEGGIRGLTTKALNEEEKKDKTFDFIGGFEIIDDEFRMFLFEGLSRGAMKRFEERVSRLEPNTETTKILKNVDIKFKERMYLDFNLEIKRIRLRQKLSYVLGKPDIYIRTKVPENIYMVLVKINEIRKCWNIKTVDEFDYFPLSQDLISMERKYSDSLTLEDIHGEAIEYKKAKKRGKKGEMSNSPSGSIAPGQPTQLQSQQEKVISIIKIGDTVESQKTQDNQSSVVQNSQIQQKAFEHTQKIKNIPKEQQYDKLMRHTLPMSEQQKTFIYSSQTQNLYEKQMAELRQQIREDKDNFYTYSKQFLTLSIDPFSKEEVKKEEERLHLEKIQGKPHFRAIPVRSKDERLALPKKPPISIIDDLKENPYYIQKKVAEEERKPTRGNPIRKPGLEEFNPYIGRIDEFSRPEVVESENIKPQEKERLEREKKKKEYDDWKQKLKGTTYMYTKKQQLDHPCQLDKLKSLREGNAKKFGLLLKNNRIKESDIAMDKQLQPMPSSMYHGDQFKEQIDPFTRSPQPEHAVSKFDFDYYQQPEILTRTFVQKPLRATSLEKI